MVSGAVALLLQQRPNLTPDQVKAILKRSASYLSAANATAQGEGGLNLSAAANTATPLVATQLHVPAVGTGSLDASRGSARVMDPSGVVLSGEQDIFGKHGTHSRGRQLVERQQLVRRYVERQQLVRQLVERQQLVRQLVVRQQLVRQLVVRQQLVRQLVVRQQLVRQLVVRKLVERQQLVG